MVVKPKVNNQLWFNHYKNFKVDDDAKSSFDLVIVDIL